MDQQNDAQDSVIKYLSRLQKELGTIELVGKNRTRAENFSSDFKVRKK